MLLGLLAGLYTYDKLGKSSSFKRAGLAALAGATVQMVVDMSYVFIVGYNAARNNSAMSGLPDAWNLEELPPHGGIPVNVYARMPEAVNVGVSFGNV